MSKNLIPSALFAILIVAVFSTVTVEQEQTTSSNLDAAAIVDRMRKALEPPIPSVRVMSLTVTPRIGATRHVKLAQARADIDGSNRALTVVLSSPPEGQGIAFLDVQKSPTASNEFIYLPAARRVRKFTPLEAWEPFFGSDFSYQDFSFTRSAAHVKLKGTETHDGLKCYRLEEALPKNPNYSKLISWVATDTGLPVEQDYYDVSDKLYKVERYQKITTVQGVPTIMKIVMSNVQQDSRSDLDVTSIKYHQSAPQKLFDPANLPKAASDQFWKQTSQ